MKKVLMLMILSISIIFMSSYFNRVSAEKSITSVNLSWTGSNPGPGFYRATSGWYTSGSSIVEMVIFLPSVTERENGSYISYRNATLGITGTYTFDDFQYYDDQVSFYVDLTQISGFTAHADNEIQIIINYYGNASVTSIATAVSYTELYFGWYDIAYFEVADAVPDTTSYDYGYNDARQDLEDWYDGQVSILQAENDDLTAFYESALADMADDIQEAYDTGWAVGDADGYARGLASNTVDDFQFDQIFSYFFETFSILSIEVLPNVTLGMIASVPLILGLMGFIFGVATFSMRSGSSIGQSVQIKSDRAQAKRDRASRDNIARWGNK